MDPAGRVAVVTGAGSGIGRAIALACAAAGMRVACAGRRPDALEETVRRVREADGVGIAVPMDVTDATSVERLVAVAEDELGGIDLLVNDAGRFASVAPIWDADPHEWWSDVTVNLLGTFLCTRAVLPGMRARDRGVIVQLDGGGGGTGPNLGGSAYGASKAAIVRFTEGLARELEADGSGVLAFSVFPGFVRTAMTEALVGDPIRDRWQPYVVDALARGVGEAPEACAELVLALVRQAGPELNGCRFEVGQDVAALARDGAAIAARRALTLRLVPAS